MRNALILLASLGMVGCTTPTVIGTPCQEDSDCNIEGQRCAPSFDGTRICTRPCTGQTGVTGCPIGYDCTVGDPAIGRTCNRAPYAFDETTGDPVLYGKDCALDANACQGTGDPNPAPSCRVGSFVDPKDLMTKPLVTDPRAYCTGTCNNTAECPLGFVCAKDYDDVQKCLKRAFCSECTNDDECPKEFPSCIPTRDGTSRYCSKPCNSDGDCGGAQNTFLTCMPSSNAAGQQGNYCLHKYGACVGAGEICDPCRTREDCAKSRSSCVTIDATGERMCTKRCTTDADCASPNGSTCDNILPMFPGAPEPTGLCTGDKDKVNTGVLSCHF